MERIIFAAIKVNNCIIYGKHHAECIKRAVKDFGMKPPIATNTGGFLTSKFRFVSRAEALYIACDAKQIRLQRISSMAKRLFTSEEFWSKRSGGIHSYDPDKGYFVPDGTENV